MRRKAASSAWIHQSLCAGIVRAIEREMASSKPAKGSVAREVAICARSGNYRSVFFGLFRASAKGGEISLFLSANSLKSAIGCRSRGQNKSSPKSYAKDERNENLRGVP